MASSKASVLWRWLLRGTFAFLLGGLVLLAVGAALYFPVANALHSCFILANNGAVLLADGVYLPVALAYAAAATPPVQTVIVSIDGYANATAAAADSLRKYPTNSTFSCYTQDDGSLLITDQQHLDATLAVFVIGCVVAAVFACVALGTFIFAHVSMRKDVHSCWKRSKAWKEWWWMSALPNSSDDERQPEQAAVATAAPARAPATQTANDFDTTSDIML